MEVRRLEGGQNGKKPSGGGFPAERGRKEKIVSGGRKTANSGGWGKKNRRKAGQHCMILPWRGSRLL